MASEKNRQAGSELEALFHEVLNYYHMQNTRIADVEKPVFAAIVADWQSELQKRKLGHFEAFDYDGFVQLALTAGVDDPESLTFEKLIRSVIVWSDIEIRQANLEKYRRKLRQSVNDGNHHDGDNDTLRVDELSAQYRHDESPDGELLTARFLKGRFGMSQSYLSKHEKDLAGRRKRGRGFVYVWKEVLALNDRKNANME